MTIQHEHYCDVSGRPDTVTTSATSCHYHFLVDVKSLFLPAGKTYSHMEDLDEVDEAIKIMIGLSDMIPV